MSEPSEDIELQLLLAHAEDHLPVLEHGLSGASLRDLPIPEPAPPGAPRRPLAASGDPDDLAARRWGVLVSDDDDGDRTLDAIRALVEHRREQQGAAPQVYRVAPGMDAPAATRWREGVLCAVPERERPRFLLILGDLDRVSLDLQRSLAGDAHVGRLHCPTLRGYRDYAEKLVARERLAPAARGRALFYTVQDGTTAIQAGYGELVEPAMAFAREGLTGGEVELATVAEVSFSDWGPDEMLALAGVDEPSVLVSLAHGVGAPRGGWRSPEQQRALQGALSMGLESPLAADSIQRTAFLPGGVLFCAASFAAGTPAVSAFDPWLRRLAARGEHRQAAQAILSNSPAGDGRPFVAALPQSLLANPRGPLAVIGPAELGWALRGPDPRDEASRAAQLSQILHRLLAGRRVGVAFDLFARAVRRACERLASLARPATDAEGRTDSAHARAWLQCRDLAGYVLLGDPAARMAVRGLPYDPRDMSDPPEVATPAPEPPLPAAQSSVAPPPPSLLSSQSSAAPHPPQSSQSPAPPAPLPSSQSPQSSSSPPPPPPSQPAEPPSAQPVFPARSPAPPSPSSAVTTLPAESPMSTTANAPSAPPAHDAAPAPPLPIGAAPLGAVTRPRTLENPEIALRERAVLAMLRGDEAPRSIAVRFGLPLEEIFYWLDVYREAGRRSLAG